MPVKNSHFFYNLTNINNEIPSNNNNNNNNQNSRLDLDYNNFGNNDKKILDLFNHDNDLKYSFNGMTKKLKMHQQSLSRVLKRLEYIGIIEKTDAGYKLNKSLNFDINGNNHQQNILNNDNFLLVAQLNLPNIVDFDIILNNLEGKWFDTFRWMGTSEKKNEKILTWVFQGDELTNFEINLYFNNISKIIQIKSNTKNDQEKIHSISLASKLINNIGLILNLNLANITNYKINFNIFYFYFYYFSIVK
jgi:DNA-binding Lrp family transcriptional regulator